MNSSSQKPDGNPEEDGQGRNGQDISMDVDQEDANLHAPTPESSSQATPNVATSSKGSKKSRRSKNSPEPNYSAMVQEQMSTTNRTGQACDRCKGRKMKCDSNPTGCANCIASESVCTQTDPITKVSSIRGELERLRQDCQTLRQENHELRQTLNRSSELMRGYRNANQNEQTGTLRLVQHALQGQQTPHTRAAQGYVNGGSSMARSGNGMSATGTFPATPGHYGSMQGRALNGNLFLNNHTHGMGVSPMAPQPQPQQDHVNGYNVPGRFPTSLMRPPSSTSSPSSGHRHLPQLGQPINLSQEDDQEDQKYQSFNPHQHFRY